MNILINGQPIDVTLEKEDTLADVIQSVESWLSASHLVLTSVVLGDREMLSVPESEWISIDPSQIDSVDMTVRHVQELKITNLKTMEEFLQMLATSVQQQSTNFEELLPGLSYLVESARQHLEPGTVEKFEQLNELIQNQPATLDQAQLTSIDTLIDTSLVSVRTRLRELVDPKSVLPGLIDELSQSIADISEVSILLQTGKDRPAMEAVIRFSELSQSLIRVFAILEVPPSLTLGEKQVDAFFAELNEILNDLLQAFDTQDSVLIGDLLEYEIAPRLEELKSFVESLT